MDQTVRDDRIDILKGIAIFMVVLGHIQPPQKVVDFIYAFHMPLFMFLSGCTFYGSFQKRLKNMDAWRAFVQYMLVRIRSLLLPFAAWSMLRSLFYKQSLNPVLSMQTHFDALWFLPTLFGILLMACLVEALTEQCQKIHRGGGMEDSAAGAMFYRTAGLRCRLSCQGNEL